MNKDSDFRFRITAAESRVRQELMLVQQLTEAVLANPSGKIPQGQQPYIPVIIKDVEVSFGDLIHYLKNYVKIANSINP